MVYSRNESVMVALLETVRPELVQRESKKSMKLPSQDHYRSEVCVLFENTMGYMVSFFDLDYLGGEAMGFKFWDENDV